MRWQEPAPFGEVIQSVGAPQTPVEFANACCIVAGSLLPLGWIESGRQ